MLIKARLILSVSGLLCALVFALDPVLQGFNEDLPPFDVARNSYNWQYYRDYQTKHGRLTTDMLFNVTGFLVPYIEATSRNKGEPPVIPPPDVEVDCEAHRGRFSSGLFTGQRRVKKPRIFDFVPISHELDLLEIRMFELNDTVDYFVILEGTHTHRGQRKHLFFARNFDRFLPFRKKIIHVIADDGAQLKYAHEKQSQGDVWDIEHQMRVAMYKKFVQAVGEPADDDLLIHGDLDEIPGRNALLMFKHCEISANMLPLSFTGPFFRWNLNHLAPYPNHELSYPNIFLKRHLVEKGGEVSLVRRYSNLVGQKTANHLNRFCGSAVDHVYKEAAMAEGGRIDFAFFEGGLAKLYQVTGQTPTFWAQTAPPDTRTNLPWMLTCFPERYPYFWWTPEEARKVIDDITNGKQARLPAVFSSAASFSCPNRQKYFKEPSKPEPEQVAANVKEPQIVAKPTEPKVVVNGETTSADLPPRVEGNPPEATPPKPPSKKPKGPSTKPTKTKLPKDTVKAEDDSPFQLAYYGIIAVSLLVFGLVIGRRAMCGRRHTQ